MPKKTETRVVLTGGHAASTAIATVEEILKRKNGWELFWIGPKRAIEGKAVSTFASQVLPDYGVYYHPIVAGRLQRKWSRYTLMALAKVPIGFFHAIFLLLKIRPNIVVSFGGYAAFPVVVIAWLFRIPVVIHTQTVAIGLANKFSSFFAKYITIARNESAGELPASKVVLVGNPVMSAILKVPVKKKMSEPPVLYITGGSTGSQNINRVVEYSLPFLLDKFKVIHQTGDLDFERFSELKKTLDPKARAQYEIFSFSDHIWDIFEKADIIVSRAGANTISEILITGRPAILIPHPFVNLNEQNRNADLIKSTGQFLVLSQIELTSTKFITAVERVQNDWHKMANAESPLRDLDSGAAERLVDLLTKCVN